MNSITFRASESKPCPVCGTGSKGCSATADGLHFCRGTPGDGWRKIGEDDNGFGHYRRDDPDGVPARTPKPKPKPKLEQKPTKDWQPEATQFAKALDRRPELRQFLADMLGLPVEVFTAFQLGINSITTTSTEFTIPERDGSGKVIGINIRNQFHDGKVSKYFIEPSKRGLLIPHHWRDTPGTIFAVEGFTDCAALTAAGLCAIGRPNNVCGVEFIAVLIRDWPAERGIIIVGDNDRKPNGRWPGREGAESTARKLAALLNRRVLMAMPPDGVKDVREWLTHPDRAAMPWPERGAELARFLEANAEAVDPQKTSKTEPPYLPDGGNDDDGTPVRVANYKPFPVEALPPMLREMVLGVAESVDCDPAFAALPALTLAGTAIGLAASVLAKKGYEQPPLLWTVTVGDSGTGKSPAIQPFQQLALRIDKSLKSVFLTERTHYEQKLDTWKEAKTNDPATKPHSPKREYFFLEDTTIERLAENLGSSPRGVAIIRDELSGWFGSFTKYSSGKMNGSDIPNWLSLFEAGPLRYQRRTGEPRDVETDRSFVAVLGGIQPGILKGTLDNEAFIASGLAARLIFAMPPKHCPKWSDAELDSETEAAFVGIIETLRKLPFDPKIGPARIRLDNMALARFKALNNEFAASAEQLDGGPMSAAIPKAVRLALRLALIHHCVAEAAASRDPLRGTIGDESMLAGETLARWFLGEAERIYAMLREKPEDRTLRRLVELIQRKGGIIRARDLMRCRKAYATAESAEAALDELVQAGYGYWQADPIPERGGHVGRTFILDDEPQADSRHSPTLDTATNEPTSAAPADTRAEPKPEKYENKANSRRLSASVGCRPDASSAEAPTLPDSPAEADPPRVSSAPTQTGTLYDIYRNQMLPD